MLGRHINRITGGNRPAFALLMLIIAIAIVFLLYTIDLRTLFHNPAKPSEKTEKMPWDEEFRLLNPPGQPAKYALFPEQPQIENTLIINADAREDEQPRGSIKLQINSNGAVKGTWKADYIKDNVRYVVNVNFKGNTDPSKIYQGGAVGKYFDKKGADPSKLYFIAKGFIETDSQNNPEGNQPKTIYVTGWLNPDFSAIGQIIITADKKSYEVFTWRWPEK